MGKALSQSNNNMKFLLVVALVAGVRAEADAEADPQLLLGYPYALGHHALGYHPVVHTPVVKSVEVKPAEVKTPVVTYATHFPHAGVYPYALWGHGLPLTVPVAAPAEEEAPAVEAEARKKREAEAEAEPEADPYYLYHHHPLTYTIPVVKPVVKKVVKAAPVVTYASHPALYHPYAYGHFGYGYPYAYHPYVVTKPAEAAEEPAVESERKRREAEADPAVLASYTKINNPLPVLRTAYTIPTAYHGVYGHPFARAGVYAYGYPYVYGK